MYVVNDKDGNVCGKINEDPGEAGHWIITKVNDDYLRPKRVNRLAKDFL